ncbi:MAG: hypothetical protein ACJAZ2_001501 [Glaciecola sp.]
MNLSATCVTVNNVKSAAITTEVDICTEVQGIVKGGVNVYPNPTSGFTTVSFSPASELRLSGVQEQILQTIDVKGKAVLDLSCCS